MVQRVTASRGAEFPTGIELLHDPTRNKGTAFTEKERDALKLRGLLPPRVLTQDQQMEKILELTGSGGAHVRAREGAARGVGAPASDRAGVWGGAPC